MTPGLVGGLSNLGVKAPDLDAEIAFLRAFGGSGFERMPRSAVLEGLPLDGEGAERVRVLLGGVRLAMYCRAPYDAELEALGAGTRGGLGHVAFDVSDTDAVLAAVARAGIPPLLGPFTVDTARGRLIVTFFRSPNGTVLETQQTVAPPR
jgi:catechol 2,3-dioxygenase-like lactoylglutathione lyase family enzyme